ncbi:MAG: hypothetical protein K0S47_3647 [Herbinix sp.]|nr:hypothetical protein [Herbinix sp.]
MSQANQKSIQSSESYSPKDKPEIFHLLDHYGKQTFSEKLAILPQGSGTPPTRGKIENIHRLYYADKGENFMFDGCMRGVLEALGEDPSIYNYDLMMAICGDMFTQMYRKGGESDCLMDNCFAPEVALHAFQLCGYESIFFTRDELNSHSNEIMDIIKKSILRNAPLISIGVGNIPVTKEDGEKVWNGTTPIVNKTVEVPFASIIGGYEDDNLFANVWLEEAMVEENGYTKVHNALSSSKGLLVVGNKMTAPTLQSVYHGIINTLPVYLTLPGKNGYSFGKRAFYEWADNIRSKEILAVNDKWNMHFAPAVILYTNAGRAREFFNRVIDLCPDYELAIKLKPLYEKAVDLNNELDKLQGGFDFDAERFAENDFNIAHTDILYKLGDLQDEILKVFSE